MSNKKIIRQPNPQNYEGLPPDLFPRAIREGELRRGPVSTERAKRDEPAGYLGEAIFLSRNFVGQTITVTTSPTLLIKESYDWPYIILNPSRSIGLTSSVTALASGVVSNGATTSSFAVSGVNQVHLIADVTAIGGAASWDVYSQILDPVSGNWADTQIVFTLTATGTTYAFPNKFGVGTDMRFRFDRTAGAGTITVSIGTILKEGTGGNNAGLAQVVYLGGPGVSTVSGFPLLEGTYQPFVVGENVELYGVANTNIDIRLFKL